MHITQLSPFLLEVLPEVGRAEVGLLVLGHGRVVGGLRALAGGGLGVVQLQAQRGLEPELRARRRDLGGKLTVKSREDGEAGRLPQKRVGEVNPAVRSQLTERPAHLVGERLALAGVEVDLRLDEPRGHPPKQLEVVEGLIEGLLQLLLQVADDLLEERDAPLKGLVGLGRGALLELIPRPKKITVLLVGDGRPLLELGDARLHALVFGAQLGRRLVDTREGVEGLLVLVGRGSLLKLSDTLVGRSQLLFELRDLQLLRALSFAWHLCLLYLLPFDETAPAGHLQRTVGFFGFFASCNLKEKHILDLIYKSTMHFSLPKEVL